MQQIDHALLQYAAKLADSADTESLEKAYQICIALFRQYPESPHVANIIAHCYSKIDRPETAYFIYRYIQKFKEYDCPQVWNNIGHCLAEREHWEQALGFFNRAVAKDEKDSIAHANLASVYCKSGDPRKAVKHAEIALELDPDSKEGRWNGSLALLKLKEWEKGWEWYDALLGTKQRPHPPALNGVTLPLWEGREGVVLVNGEQGLGDEIMFSSIIPDAVKKAKIVLAVDSRLVGLLQRTFPEAMVISRNEKQFTLPEPVDFTHRYALGSLGRLFRNRDADFPGEPYLKACPIRSTMYRGLLDSLGPHKKIGILWKGGVGGLDEYDRSMTLNELEPLLVNDAHWVSLNHLPSAKNECERFYDTTGIKVHHWDFVHSKDYDDTAALVSQLDCVVSVTGTVAHCAAALGVPTHVLVPRMPQWRYGHEGTTIPWYKSMTLYRQTDKWPLADVAEAVFGLR